MTTRQPFAPDECYHVYNRGTEKRTIFQDPADYDRFLALLYLSKGSDSIRLENLRRREQGSTLLTAALECEIVSPRIAIGAYCLMPNHFHLLVRTTDERGLSEYMQKLTTAYTMYFNVKNGRTGALLQGRFKAEHAGQDRYLKYLFSYIHLNPVSLVEPGWQQAGLKDRRRAKRFLEGYRYSSYLDYQGSMRPENAILQPAAFPNYFDSGALFQSHIDDWLEYRAGESGQGPTR